jgi:hypothetical protein
MRSRLATLNRLRSLYGDIEELRSMQMQRTTAAVREVEQAIESQDEKVCSSGFDGRKAVMAGDRMDWTAARVQREIAEWRQQRLQQVRAEREILNEEARRQYLASRLQSEQMKRLVEGAESQIEIETGRRTQAALDDRFLTRRRWTDAQKTSPRDS